MMPTDATGWVLHNGQLLPAAGFALPHSSRAALYGDGCFETMVWSAGHIRYVSDHLARLHQACAVLQLQLPSDLQSAEDLAACAARLTAANNLASARLRLQCWRSGAGLYLPETSQAEYILTAAPLHLNNAPIKVAGIAQQVHTVASPLAFCKGPQGWLYVLAAQERAARGLDELVLLDAQGHVAEAVAAAVFWLREGQLFTSALSTGCVAGVRRAHLLRVAQAQGLPCQEGLFGVAELLQAEAVFTANVAGIRAVQQVQGVRFKSEAHPLLQALRQWDAED
ncbi:aminotransferase class IV [Hymenobacter busanensis]|uniref:branched-chain-amino-acid transaminase n=1 Tax=Hymenobacter busanensis TaxID=2607656 RepID=A0A7L4ZT52_9BACT|nr:aminotransferase class IV [Hymenobacter busanensis]KAA9325859.1 aminotransferase class IV [Hymenobacter busanensis]QHJ06301.1 aminotransferase IV [Hymenobacter busanensis]